MIDDAKYNCHRKVFLCIIKAVKQFIELCNNIGSTCTPRRNISQTTAVKFLYARKFDVPRAVSLYEQHEQIRLKEGLYNIDPDVEPLRSELQTGKFTILSARDSSGAAIALFTANKHSPLCVTHTTTLQGIVYQLDCALQDTETQKAGLVFIYDMSGSKYSNFDYDLSQKILTLLKGGYPARLKKVLIVTAPLWFKAPFKILRLFVREKLRERVFTVSVPTLSLHVPRRALPIHLGGTLEIEHNTWLLHCRKSMTNREDELLANIGGLSAATAATAAANQNSLSNQSHITNTVGVVANGDCQRFLAEPNENITNHSNNTSTTTAATASPTSLLNGHHNNSSSIAAAPLVPIANNLNNLNNSTSPNNAKLLAVGLANGGLVAGTIVNGDLVHTATSPSSSSASSTPLVVNGIVTGISALSGSATAGSGGGGGGVVVGQTTPTNNTSATNNTATAAGTTTTTGLSDFWTENPPSSASSGFSDDDSLAGQEGDPKTIEQIVQMVKTRGRQGLVKEYAEIRSRAPDGTFLHARMRNNVTKNRYTDVLCYDHSRVVLSRVGGDEVSDYINANFVDGYKQKNAYISTQGPLPKTSQDFWRMIWEQHCLVIVMTTRVMERGRVKCGQYWEPAENSSLEFGNFHVRTLSIETNEDYTVASLELRNTKTDEVRNVSHWQFTSWPDYGVPSSAMAMITFLQKVREKQAQMVQALGDTWAGHPRGPPIVVHCSAGIGRTGTFITLDICISRLEDVGTADIRGTVEKIRAQRAYSIQMPDQYVFCHLALIEYAISRGMLKAVDLEGFDDREDDSE
ncbi:tyrosine-protein phosphatase non-receptor type 9 isoform X2 [Stomoxys calcitrans]|uniref:tyrosine-protein phosphatase non-receptor type 9 isoform X2 n=1 Tax=Stomoxys calcitrans TaxID=35570 RepID=UPI0027E26061|nr:tyrosine-protein phosphatase non-receptor type 9 isoform X2 [Stomoxys calcitrans]